MAVQILRGAAAKNFKVLPTAAEYPDAPVVDLKKLKTTATGEQIQNSPTTKERAADKVEVEAAITKMIERGDIVVRPVGSPVDTTDPDLREHFGRLLYMGATRETICQILKIQRDTYRKLKRQHLESVVESLAETGVMGMVAMAFDKIEMASTRTLQLIASMGDTPEERSDLLSAIRTLKDIENDKISMLVKTGAIKVKKKIEISGHMEALTGGTTPLLTGEKAKGTMVRILSTLVEAGEEDESDDSSEGT